MCVDTVTSDSAPVAISVSTRWTTVLFLCRAPDDIVDEAVVDLLWPLLVQVPTDLSHLCDTNTHTATSIPTSNIILCGGRWFEMQSMPSIIRGSINYSLSAIDPGPRFTESPSEWSPVRQYGSTGRMDG